MIGKTGDTIEIRNGAIFRNGEKLQEDYISEKPNYILKKLKVPDNNYFREWSSKDR